MNSIEAGDQVKGADAPGLPQDSAGERPIRFAGSALGVYRHICAFFRTPDEEYRVLLPFIKEGFERGDRAFHVVNPARRADHVRRLEAAGIDSTAAQRTG